MRISKNRCERPGHGLTRFGTVVLLCLIVFSCSVSAQEVTISEKEYEIYEMLLLDMSPVDEFDCFLKSENPDYVMPRLKLLVSSETCSPRFFDSLTFGAERLPDSIPLSAREQMTDDLFRKIEATSTIEDRFSALVSVRVTTDAEIESIVGDEPFAFWEALHEKFGPCAIVDFSRVGLDSTGAYGVLYYSYTSGPLSGVGYRVVVLRKEDKWEVCDATLLWIS